MPRPIPHPKECEVDGLAFKLQANIDRSTAASREEGLARRLIGILNHGSLRIGDTPHREGREPAGIMGIAALKITQQAELPQAVG